MNSSRRNMLKMGGAALALIPVVAFAAKNDGMRASTKYKDTPDGDKKCSNCAQFVPGKTEKDLGAAYPMNASHRVAEKLAGELGRVGKKAGMGFYDYPQGGVKHIWPELAKHYPVKPESEQPTVAQIVERLIMVQSADTVRCLEEGVLKAPIDADVGSILGWGFPPFRGGPLGWLHTIGVKQAVADLERLEKAHGVRFAVPKKLREMAAKGEDFFAV